MRKLSIGIGAGAVVLSVALASGVAAAASGSPQRASGTATATSAVITHVTSAQARRIAEAKVPHSRSIAVESDDLHDRAVWKVTLSTPHGRVAVDVDKRTGRATILGRGGQGGRAQPTATTSLPADHGRDARDHDNDNAREVRDDTSRDLRDDDHGRDDRHDRDELHDDRPVHDR